LHRIGWQQLAEKMARQLRASRLLEELKMFAGFDAVRVSMPSVIT